MSRKIPAYFGQAIESSTLLLFGLGALWNLKKIPRTKSRKFFEFHGAAILRKKHS